MSDCDKVPKTTLHEALLNVQMKLQQSHPGFQTLHTLPIHYYKFGQVLVASKGNALYLTLKIPISFNPVLIDMFSIESFVVPINQPTRYTHFIFSHPYLAFTYFRQYYATFSQADYDNCEGCTHPHCPVISPLVLTSQVSCLSVMCAYGL